MKTRLLVILFLLASVITFGQRAKQNITPDNAYVKTKITVPDLVVSKISGFDDIKANTITTVVGDTAALYINWKLGNFQALTLSDTAEVTMIAPPVPCNLALIITHAANTTNFPLYFNSPIVKWVGGTDYTPTNTSGAVDIIHFLWNGTYYYAFFDKDYKN